MPLRHDFHRGILSTGLLHDIAPPSRFHNGSKFRDSVPLRHGFHRSILSIDLLQCRCGIAFRLAPATGSLIIHLILLPPSSTFRRCADFPLFRLTFRRCVESPHLRERPVSVFLQPPCVSHLPKVCSIPPFSSHLPKVCRGVIASRAPCISVYPPSTFRRCADFPRFRLTFRRCAVSK